MAVIKKIKVMSLAKIQGLIMLFFGLLLSLATVIIFAITKQPIDYRLVIATPISYGLAGFVMGAITSALYNVISKKIGGLEIELKK